MRNKRIIVAASNLTADKVRLHSPESITFWRADAFRVDAEER